MGDARVRQGGGVKRPSYRVAVAPAPIGHGMIFTAVRLALSFAHRPPTVVQLQQQFGMSRATAYRWVRAFKVARGELADA